MATTASGNYVSDNSTLTNFKAWSMAISDAFAAFGWTQTGDTGQVDWTTIAAVPSSAYVYEVWEAADAAASTLPIFVKIEYGFSTTSPRIRVTVGTGSNGSGTITGGVISSAPWEITSGETNRGASTPFASYFSGDAGQFRMYLWASTSVSCATIFGIERSKDSTGAVTSDYFTVLSTQSSSNGSGASNQQTIISASVVANRENGIIAPAISSASGTGAFSGSVAALPVFPLLGKVGNPMKGWMVAAASDVSDGATVTVTSLYGSSHTFVAINSSGASGNMSFNIGQRGSNGTPMALLMLFE